MTFITPSTLPEFHSQFVIQQGETFLQSQTSLFAFQKETGNGVILYFYPKDCTAGCTTQAQDFNEHLAEFEKLGFTVIGVSRDSVASHQRFITNNALKIGLINDKDEQLCHYFGIIGEKMLYGKTVQGVVRSTFIFDKSGHLLHEYRNVRAKEHAKKVLVALSQVT